MYKESKLRKLLTAITDMCTQVILNALSTEHNSVAQASPSINMELCACRRTKSGLRCREPACSFDTLRYQHPTGHKIGTAKVPCNEDAASSQKTGTEIGDDPRILKNAVNTQSPATALHTVAAEVIDQKIHHLDINKTANMQQLPKEKFPSQASVARSVSDYLSLVVGLLVGHRYYS